MPKLKRPVTSDERIEARKIMIADLDAGKIELGSAIRKMRLEWTGLSQARFGKIVGISANTISAIEREADTATLKTLKRILMKFGMTVTIRPESHVTAVTTSEPNRESSRATTNNHQS